MRSYVKVARPADVNTRYTAQRAVVGYEGGEGGGAQGPKGDKGDTGPEGPPGKDGESKSYILQTDKNFRSGDDPLVPVNVGDPHIELLDEDGFFSDVKFIGGDGITVTSDLQSIIISGSGDSSELEGRITDGEAVQEQLLTTVQAGLLKQQGIQNQIDELGVTKGKVARYTVTEINNVPSASRPGQLVVNAADPSEVTLVSFGTEDLDNILTKPMANGDIVEFVDAADGTINRFTVLDAQGAPTLVAVSYVSGDNTFVVGEEEQVYIFPQNGSGTSKEYVDGQDALLQSQIDDISLDGFVSLSGVNKLDPGTWRLQQEDSVTRGLSNYIVVQDDLLKLYHVDDPTSAEHAANKRYVDSVASGKSLPPGLRFKYTNTEGVEQDNGLFSYYEIDGEIKLRLNNVSRDVHWNYNGHTGNNNYNEGHLFTIYNVDSNGRWRIIRKGTINKIQWANGFVEFGVSTHQTNGSFSTSYDYYITIAGIC